MTARASFTPPHAADRPHTRSILEAVLAAWPQHAAFLTRHFSARDARDADAIDALAAAVSTLAGDELATFAADYRWMCALFLKHELDYRRHRRLRHAAPAEIRAAWYDNAADMTRYMRGLLISQLTWPQHLGVQLVFRHDFLPRLPTAFRYLEIGPGHGVTMALAGADPRCASLTGQDIAPASLAATRSALARLGVTRAVELELGDICAAPEATARYDAVCLSQVLELVASPAAAIAHLAALLAPGGLLFINAPVEMRAPDHLRVWQHGDELDALLVEAGLDIVARHRVHVDPLGQDEKQGYSYVVLASPARAA